jgi:acetyl-CoA synthetase
MSGPELYMPSERARSGAKLADLLTYETLYRESLEHPEEFWAREARQRLLWQHDFRQVMDCDFGHGGISWFLGGKLNVSENCIDRHVAAGKGDQVALLWEGDEPGNNRRVTYRELLREVCRLANVLRHHGLRKGDRVAIYMPMIPEAAFAMLACARLGIVHSVVFAGFSAESLRDRIIDSRCKAVITADEGIRGRKAVALKRTVDEAVPDR